MVVVGSWFTGAEFILMRVLGAVLRYDRGVLSHQYVSRVVFIRIHRVLGFVFFFWDFIWEILLSISMESASPMSALYFILLFWTALSCIHIYYCFIYSVWFIYLFHIAFRTYVSSCVRGGIVTPNLVNYFGVWHAFSRMVMYI
jgi:hypothetical protein